MSAAEASHDQHDAPGPTHITRLRSRNNLAMAYRAAGRTAEAIPLLERTLAGCERVRGTDHPDTLTLRNNLAMAYRAAGRTAEAIPLLERTLADCERMRGADHPDTKAAREGLAALTSKPKRHRHV
jgi:tetratricopeptide (TPR) repeat protein